MAKPQIKKPLIEKSLIAAAAALVAMAAPSAAPAQQTGSVADPCADLGSFAIVDAPPPRRGAPIVAGSGNPCADLPGRPQPQVFIDAQVQVGNGMSTPDQNPGQLPVQLPGLGPSAPAQPLPGGIRRPWRAAPGEPWPHRR